MLLAVLLTVVPVQRAAATSVTVRKAKQPSLWLRSARDDGFTLGRVDVNAAKCVWRGRTIQV